MNFITVQALKFGAKSYMEPKDQFWGDRECAVYDQDGYLFSFARPLKGGNNYFPTLAYA